MIYIIHGDDLKSAYLSLRSLLDSYKEYSVINIPPTLKNINDFILEGNSIDLFYQKRIIIAEDLISKKIISLNALKKNSSNNILIFWEKKNLLPKTVKSYKNIATILQFKQQRLIFNFLDSFSPNYKNTLTILAKIGVSEQNLLWHFTFRLLLLIFSKLRISLTTASSLTGHQIHDWQWQKIKQQSQLFNLNSLFQLYSSALKLDNNIKSGKTNLNLNSLLSLLIIKYSK